MNQRIKQLLSEAKIYDGYDSMTQAITTCPRDLEKFAKLIVEECMWKIMTRKEEAIDNNWRVDEAMSAAISDISEHFGVEE